MRIKAACHVKRKRTCKKKKLKALYTKSINISRSINRIKLDSGAFPETILYDSSQSIIFNLTESAQKLNSPVERLGNHNRLKSNPKKNTRATLEEHIPEGPKTKEEVTDPFNFDTVKRLYSPFHRFHYVKEKPSPKNKNSTMPKNGSSRTSGLTPKERSFLINTCEAKTNRYSMLKKKAADAQKKKKIFCIHGQCSAVRKALTARGWVEKIPANKMNLMKLRNGTILGQNAVSEEMDRLLLSNLVERTQPDFLWFTDRSNRSEYVAGNTIIMNRLSSEPTWTTKEGLCAATKHNHWNYIEDVAEVDSPRTYQSHDSDDHDEFITDFRLTACTSLLKWVISMIVNKKPIFDEDGTISINVLLFAISRCKEYLFSKQNKDIDKPIQEVSSRQWNIFLRKYYRLIAKNDVFQSNCSDFLMYIVYSKFLLKEILKYRPQLRCEGCHNIWIIKPISLSRGRGIRMASNLNVITNLISNKINNKHVVQKYIEEPLLIHNTKFDIRQYYLVTSTQPLEIWMYKECYLKFSSQRYDLKDYHESIHLTNNAVQKNYKNCDNRHPDLPINNMWDLKTFKDYLDLIDGSHVWDQIIYPTMKKNIIGVMLSCQDSMMISKNRFELFGCDFLIDKRYRPWLIEINSCPDLNSTTSVTANICPAVIEDVMKVVIDRSKKANAPTGNFECAFKQTVVPLRHNMQTDLTIKGHALPKNYFYNGTILGQSDNGYMTMNHNNKTSENYGIKKIKRKIKGQEKNKMTLNIDQESTIFYSDVGTYTNACESDISPTISIVIGENLTDSSSPSAATTSKIKVLQNQESSNSDTFTTTNKTALSDESTREYLQHALEFEN